MKWYEENNLNPLVYLAGPINGCTDDECMGWRETAKQLLKLGTKDPMDRDYRGSEEMSVNELVDGDKQDIAKCVWLLANCPKPSYGTPMEILFAYERGVKVVVVVPEGRVSPWLTYHAREVFHTIEDACEYINNQ